MSDTKITIGPVRFSYANVWKPKANDEGVEKYTIAVLFSKKSAEGKAIKKKVERAIAAAITAGSKVLAGKKNIRKPLRDGDEDREGDGAYEGMYFINCNSDVKPTIVDKDKEDILDQRQFYSGCYGYISINFGAYNKKGNAGIGAYLNNIMKTKDGDPLTSRGTAESDFADIEIDEDDEDSDEDGSEYF